MPLYGRGNLLISSVGDFDWALSAISLCQISGVENRNFLTDF